MLVRYHSLQLAGPASGRVCTVGRVLRDNAGGEEEVVVKAAVSVE